MQAWSFITTHAIPSCKTSTSRRDNAELATDHHKPSRACSRELSRTCGQSWAVAHVYLVLVYLCRNGLLSRHILYPAARPVDQHRQHLGGGEGGRGQRSLHQTLTKQAELATVPLHFWTVRYRTYTYFQFLVDCAGMGLCHQTLHTQLQDQWKQHSWSAGRAEG